MAQLAKGLTIQWKISRQRQESWTGVPLWKRRDQSSTGPKLINKYQKNKEREG